MIPLVDLKTQYHNLKSDIDAAIARVLENTQFALGPAVESFERDFSSYCGTTQTVSVNSGTSACASRRRSDHGALHIRRDGGDD
jgi:dTDP-4-amino-4,6-dideoxygalactose transaminase